ncbi:MAG: hypothetical protein E7Z73_07315 [Methanobrevibacter millerae]|uniref:Uncharacterized protein n=1 Tax=Methanobrevibacter millerae TaxID=230361 RepID=A0A8T3VLH6_9EURY|nr:hypothetical protein [Methanobrevibacter millerae]MBE6505530.1 hypothetical protein [Methanobrevibacter millerae]
MAIDLNHPHDKCSDYSNYYTNNSFSWPFQVTYLLCMLNSTNCYSNKSAEIPPFKSIITL